MVTYRHGKRCIITYSSCTGTPTVRITSRYRIFRVLSNSTLVTTMRGREPSVVIPRVRTVHARGLCSYRGVNVRIIPDTQTIGFAVGHGRVHRLTRARLNLGATSCHCTGAFRRLGTTTSIINFPYVVGPLVDSSNRKRDGISAPRRLRGT